MNLADAASTALLALVVAGGIYNLGALYCAMDFFKKDARRSPDVPFPPVSILKPVRGLDPEFRANIESFCKQDYPEFEVLIGVADKDDAAIAEVGNIAASNPGWNLRAIVTGEPSSANRKVDNLKGLNEAARFELIAISDADMRVGHDYLQTIVSEYIEEEDAGLVTSLYKISEPCSFGSSMESLMIALDFIPSVLVARRLEGITFGLGASMLLSKKAVEEMGGFDALSDHLADDYQIGNRISKSGRRIILSDYVLEDVVGCMSLREFLSHQVRWARTYRASRPWGFFGYGITHVFFFSVLLLLVERGSAASCATLLAAMGLRLSSSLVMYRKVVHSKKWLKWLPLLPLKDVLSFGIWAWSFIGNKVRWRGALYEVEKGGTIRPCERPRGGPAPS